MPNKLHKTSQKKHDVNILENLIWLDNPSITRPRLLPKRKPNTRQIALFSVLVAVCSAIQALPRPFVEFTSLLTFSTGVVFGGVFGASLGAFVMLLNCFISPFGFGGTNTPFQMLGMGIIGIVGGFFKIAKEGKAGFYAEAAILGAFLTLVYQLILNVGYAVFYLTPPLGRFSLLEAIVAAEISGAVVTSIYTLSNTILFGFGILPLVHAMTKILGR
jgi:hypothetical protein